MAPWQARFHPGTWRNRSWIKRPDRDKLRNAVNASLNSPGLLVARGMSHVTRTSVRLRQLDDHRHVRYTIMTWDIETRWVSVRLDSLPEYYETESESETY